MLCYKIAETIGCFVSDIEDKMSLEEFYGWASWFELKNEEMERQYKEYEQKSKRSR